VLGFICNDAGAGGRPRQGPKSSAPAEQHLARFRGDSLVHASLAVSIPEVATDAMLHRVCRLAAAEAGAIFQTHVNEHLVAVERSLVERGLAAARTSRRRRRAWNPNVLIAHSTFGDAGRADAARPH